MPNYQKQVALNQNELVAPSLRLRTVSVSRRFISGYWPLLVIVLLHLALLLTYSSLTPLGEAPDEPAHLDYARFIAQNGRLPATLAERQAAG